jgi:3-isopropylmalate dehydrogenase
MMLRYSFALEAEAEAIENAVLATLEQGHRTYDIMSDGKTKVGTKKMGDLIAQEVKD